jgi:uncharacterized protein YmfQ (DUF2313 family)
LALNRHDYLQLLKSLLPPGKAWTSERNSSFEKILIAVADELTRIQNRTTHLLKELNPFQTQEMITDWERLLGLPNECTGPTSLLTFQARKKLVNTFYTMSGGNTSEYLVELIKNFGFDIEISEYKPFKSGYSSSGDPISNGNWRYAFQVRTLDAPVFRFSSGQNTSGDPLVEATNELIKCIINDNKPAHTIAIFTFS